MKETIKLTRSDVVEILDQTKLPFSEKIIATTNYIEIIKAIKQLSIRGAPAIGVAGAFAAYLALKSSRYRQFEKLSKEILFKLKSIESARPTAVNLSWSINRFRRIIISSEETNYKKLVTIFRKEAMAISKEESNVSVMISEVGSKLIKRNSKIITHCNTGSLATTGPGTALGVIKFANTKVKGIKVFATETRPLLQGSRLTIYECQKNKIDCTLITDSMASYIIKKEKIDFVIVGADRIASNGDTANKIGTYQLAISAKFHKIPFYVAAPISTFDFSAKTGLSIKIEQRNIEELTYFEKKRISNSKKASNPAFDITPKSLISGIITEKGIIRNPNLIKINKFKNRYL